MNKLFGLFLLALAFFAPDLAQAANRFAICTTTCTWDNTSTAMWSTSSNGATGASAPVAGDDVIFDSATCQGGTTCTITTFAGTISASTVTWGGCTASTSGCIIDASVNNTNFTLSSNAGTAFSGTGTGVRQWKAGTGTYALTSSNANGCFTMQTSTNSSGTVFSGATWSCSGNPASARSWAGGGFSFGPTTFNGNSAYYSMLITGTNTWASLTLNSPNLFQIQSGATQTITGALTINGSSASSMVTITGNGVIDIGPTLSLGAASTGTWAALRGVITSGASKLDVTNCSNLGLVTLTNGGTCIAPSGGGGGGRIIGG